MAQDIEKFNGTETRENQATKLNRLLEYIAALQRWKPALPRWKNRPKVDLTDKEL